MTPGHRLRLHLAIGILAASAGGCSLLGRNGGTPVVAPDSFAVAMTTTKGEVRMIFRRHWAPIGVDRVYQLLRERYYDDARLWRVFPGFVVQWGLAATPKATAKYKAMPIADDPVRSSNRRGTISFARGGPDSRTAQLFINLVDNGRLDRDSGFGFAPLGEVTAGMEVVDGFNGEYNGKMPGGVQDSIALQGNSYLRRAFPNLDGITRMRITQEWK